MSNIRNDVFSRFIVFGDSHSSFFSGENQIVFGFKEAKLFNFSFHINHIGPVLATSLVERQSTLMAREKIFEVLKREKQAEWDGVILAFGEIDCRFHIIKRLGHKSAILTDEVRLSITITVLRYISFIHEIMLLGYRPIVWGPVASNLLLYDNPEYPNYGNINERNIITFEFGKLLSKYCDIYEIDYLSIFPLLVTETMETKSEYYFDGVHLGQNAWQVALPLFCHNLS